MSRSIKTVSNALTLSLIFGVVLVTTSCGRTGLSPKKSDLLQSRVCREQAFELQPRQRFPQATVFYLPYQKSNEGGQVNLCPQLEWRLVDKPEDSAASLGALQRSYSGIQRFVPDAPGDYRFEAGQAGILAGGRELKLNVAGLSDIPFHNFNYYPTTALVDFQNRIWTADAISGRVTALDGAKGQVVRSIPVGGWPVALAALPAQVNSLVVLQKATDSLGFIDTEAQRLVDSIPVGDEPADLVLSPDGKLAYVSLATTAQVAVVDLIAREVIGHIDVVNDPRSMAITRDGKTLFVAAFRSGTSVRYPYADSPADSQKDIAVVDTTLLKTVRYVGDIGTTLQQILLSPDESTLFISRVLVNTRIPLAAPGNQSFGYEVAALDVATGSVLRSRGFQARADVPDDLPLGTPVGIALDKRSLWVAFESSDTVVQLGLDDFSELRRFAAPGRPRSVLVSGDRIFVHGPQNFALTLVDASSGQSSIVKLSETDPRGELLARGQSYFTGVGQSYAKGWSCNSCHVEGLTDKVVWNAGPVKDTHVSKPFFWLEGTAPLGWQGYMSSVRNYSYEVHSNIGTRADDQKVAGLQTYLRSLTVPPPANSRTELDGSLSVQGLRGQVVFNEKGRCASCHVAPVGTNGVTFKESSTEDAAEVPSLVGGYRHGVWLKHGEATTLAQAVDNMVRFAGADLTLSEKDDLIRYLEEMTGRDFFLMSATPESRKMPGSAVEAAEVPVDTDANIQLVFSLPVLDTPENLERIRIIDSSGQEVPAMRKLLSPRMIEIAAAKQQSGVSALAAGERYSIDFGKDFESFGSQKITGRTAVPIVTAAVPVVRFAGDYILRFYVPRLVMSPQGNYFDVTQTKPVDVPLSAAPTASGANVVLDLKGGLTFPTAAVVSGSSLYIPPTPVPAGPISFVDGFSGYWSTFVDSDADGIGDAASGTYTYAGPGFRLDGLKWELVRSQGTVTPVPPPSPVPFIRGAAR
jgi:DNA-binding beta-propeller fold protein YncE